MIHCRFTKGFQRIKLILMMMRNELEKDKSESSIYYYVLF
jgi:hypothetical protein